MAKEQGARNDNGTSPTVVEVAARQGVPQRTAHQKPFLMWPGAAPRNSKVVFELAWRGASKTTLDAAEERRTPRSPTTATATAARATEPVKQLYRLPEMTEPAPSWVQCGREHKLVIGSRWPATTPAWPAPANDTLISVLHPTRCLRCISIHPALRAGTRPCAGSNHRALLHPSGRIGRGRNRRGRRRSCPPGE